MMRLMSKLPLFARFIPAGILLAVVACGPAPQPTAGTTAGSGRSEPGTAADLAAIDKLRAAYLEARNSGEASRVISLWAEDGVLLPIDEPPVTGREAIAEHIQDFLDQTPGTITIHPDETRVAGDWAFERGREVLTMRESGREVALTIKYLAILVRLPDGSWKVGRYMYNLDESDSGPDTDQAARRS